MKKKRIGFICLSVLALLAIAAAGIHQLYARPEIVIEYDGCYYWNETETIFDRWKYVKSPSGWEYFLYLPPEIDAGDRALKIPMVIIFHGQSGKYSALAQFGRMFIADEFQQATGGCAVLVAMSRIDHFTDPHSFARLVKNLTIKYPCLDPERIAGYGYSQGAAFIMELAICDPSLFAAAVAGSGYYAVTAKELLRILPVQFFTAVSENDAGIFEPGSRTGKLLARYCKNSRYVQYQKRNHFWLEFDDRSGRGDETVMSWLVDILNADGNSSVRLK